MRTNIIFFNQSNGSCSRNCIANQISKCVLCIQRISVGEVVRTFVAIGRIKVKRPLLDTHTYIVPTGGRILYLFIYTNMDGVVRLQRLVMCGVVVVGWEGGVVEWKLAIGRHRRRLRWSVYKWTKATTSSKVNRKNKQKTQVNCFFSFFPPSIFTIGSFYMCVYICIDLQGAIQSREIFMTIKMFYCIGHPEYSIPF